MAWSADVNRNKLFASDDFRRKAVKKKPESHKLESRQPGESSNMYRNSDEIASLEVQRQDIIKRQREIEERTLASSGNSLELLRESEHIATATGVELVRQGKVLQDTSLRLDEMNSNLKENQKTLNSMKSMFHGVKNYVSGKVYRITSKSCHSAGSSSMYDTIDRRSINNDCFTSHPVTHFYELDEQDTPLIVEGQTVDEQLNANLHEIDKRIAKLKCHGIALHEELGKQSDLIDTINNKIDGANVKIDNQNKQMKKL